MVALMIAVMKIGHNSGSDKGIWWSHFHHDYLTLSYDADGNADIADSDNDGDAEDAIC